jgi:hypothetical protein
MNRMKCVGLSARLFAILFCSLLMWGTPRSGVRSEQKADSTQQQKTSEEPSHQSREGGAIQEGEAVGWDPVSVWDGPNPKQPAALFIVGAIRRGVAVIFCAEKQDRLRCATTRRIEQRRWRRNFQPRTPRINQTVCLVLSQCRRRIPL